MLTNKKQKNTVIIKSRLKNTLQSSMMCIKDKAFSQRTINPNLQIKVKPIRKKYINSSSLDKQPLFSKSPSLANTLSIQGLPVDNIDLISPDDINLDFTFSSNRVLQALPHSNTKFTSFNSNSSIKANETILSCLDRNGNAENKLKSVKEKKNELEKTYIAHLGKLGTYSTNALYKSYKSKTYKDVLFILNKSTLLILRQLSSTNPNLDKGKDSKEYITFDIKPLDFPFNLSSINIFYSPLCVLNFDQITTHIGINASKCQMVIYILGNNKHFKFKFSNKELLNKFAFFTNYAINRSLGNEVNLFGISFKKDFEKYYFQSEYDFSVQAKSGDCLLFKGFECPSIFQRLCTRDEYDHVALLFKKKGVLYVYESSSIDGAKVRSWSEFNMFNWNLLYEKIAYRRLIINLEGDEKVNKQKEIERNCESFINMTKGKKYKFNLCTLLCGGKIQKHEVKNEWVQSKGFFCSQLVIAAYMNCDIIPCDKNSASFLPGNLAQDKVLKLNDKLYLSPEILIEFSL